MATKTFSREEVKAHNNEDDLWTIIDHKVYDLTDFALGHPGGVHVLLQVAGTDATKAFYNLHRQEVLEKYDATLQIGVVGGEKPEVIKLQPGDLNPVPYAEPLWLQPAFKSPYYKESHRKLQKAMRVFVDKYVAPFAEEREADGAWISESPELMAKMAETNILAMRLGPGPHLHGRSLLGGVVDGKEFDYFHDLIVMQEITRAKGRGFADGNLGGMVIGLTAVRSWLDGNVPLRERVTNECLSGKKFICLAISEAFAGSDVAGLRTTAEKTPDGKHFIINGTKKWITNGMFADYFVTACRTKKGFNMILVPKGEGVEVKKIKTSYSPTAGTAYVTYDNVKVPVDHLLGREDRGFEVVMSNFNHERWGMACGSLRGQRTVVQECLNWANQRIVFGKRLIDQPTVRQKLAKMIALVESNQAWVESITYQMCNLSYKEQSKLLGGPIALLKYSVTRGAHEIADESVNIFGGRGLTQTGMGKFIEMFHRTYKFDSILGGAEEILADLGVRQAMKFMPKAML